MHSSLGGDFGDFKSSSLQMIFGPEFGLAIYQMHP